MDKNDKNHGLSFLVKGADINALQKMINDFGVLTGYCISLLDKNGYVILQSKIGDEELTLHAKQNHLCFDPGVEREGLVQELKRAKEPILKSCQNGFHYVITPVRLEGGVFGSLMLSHFQLSTGKPEHSYRALGIPELDAAKAKNLIRLLADIFSHGLMEHIRSLEHHKKEDERKPWGDNDFKSWMMDAEAVSDVSAMEALIRLEQSQSALKASEERYRTLVGNIPAIVYRCEISPPWYMHYISDHVTQITGYFPEDFSQGGVTSYADLIHKDDIQLVVDAIQKALKDESHYAIEYRIKDKSGEIHWVFERGRFYLDENKNPLYLDGVIMDITEKKKTQREKYEIETRFKSIFENMLEGVALHEMVYDKQGHAVDYIIRDVNPAYCKNIGLSREMMVNRKLQDVFPQDERPGFAKYAEVAVSGIPMSYETYFAPMKKFFHISVISMHPGTFITVMSDITQSREIQAKLQQALDEREVLVREVHHRVKNNLQAIIHLIQNQIDGATDQESIEGLSILKSQAFTMALIYDQLNKTKQLSKIEMCEYLEELAVNICSSFPRPDRILVTIECDELWLDVSRAMPVAMIVNELITNAHKHAFPKNKKGDHHLLVHLSKSGHSITLMVRDNGIGLPMDMDPDKLTSLGLKMIRLWAVHQLGGAIKMSSDNGLITEVVFPDREIVSSNDINK